MQSGNLAYKLPPEEEYELSKERAKAYRIKKKQRKMHKIKYIRRIICIVMVAGAATYMISTYVTVSETKSEISDLQAELTQLQSTNSQMMFELEQSVDLANIEKEATERLGMQRPEKYQTIYVDIQQESKTETTSQSVEGVQNRIGKFFETLKENIIERFSIK